MNHHLEARPVARRTIAHLLADAAIERGDDVFVRWQGTELTAADVDRAANRLAHGLRWRGVAPGTRVAVMMSNSPEYLALWFAIAKLGAVEVPINTAYRGELLHDQLDRARVELAIADGPFADAIAQVAHRLPALTAIVVNGDGGPGGTESYGQLLADDDNDPGLAAKADEVGCIIYTSGTTGPSKGVLLTHHQEFSFGGYWAEIVQLGADDVVLNYLPYFHIAGKFLTLGCLLTGAEMVLTPQLSIERFWSDTRQYGITHFIAVGGVCSMLHGRAPRADDADNPVKVVYAVPAPAEIYHDFEQRFGVKLVECYGSTEANLVLHTRLDESVPGPCGRPHRDFDVIVGDDEGNELPAGESGEILVRPRVEHTMTPGYDNMPDRTAEAWRDGWFHTGDRAHRDANGLFWFEDRIKDSIRRRGENISSFEVERLVAAHPAVAEVAAIGVASELGEQDVMVLVVEREGTQIDHAELLEHCVATMPYFMVPRYIEVVDELLRTPTNKVEKYRLRELGVTPSTWDREAAGWRVTRDGLARV